MGDTKGVEKFSRWSDVQLILLPFKRQIQCKFSLFKRNSIRLKTGRLAFLPGFLPKNGRVYSPLFQPKDFFIIEIIHNIIILDPLFRKHVERQ